MNTKSLGFVLSGVTRRGLALESCISSPLFDTISSAKLLNSGTSQSIPAFLEVSDVIERH